jgi:hypothetical protein
MYIYLIFFNVYICLIDSLEFCNQAAGLAEIFDSIVCNIDTACLSDVDDEAAAPKRLGAAARPKKAAARRVASASSGEEDSEGDSESEGGEGDVVQRRPAFAAEAAAAPTRERISRTSKSLAQDKMSQSADENMENQRLIDQLN